MIKHFIRYWTPNIMVADCNEKEIESRNTCYVPEYADSYQFYDKEIVIIDGETLTGQPKNQSPVYYFGEEWNLEEAKKQCGVHSVLIQNMECNKWSRVIHTSRGQCFPLNDEDVVVQKPKNPCI